MIVGTEWLIEAFNCDAETLRDVSALQNVFAQIIADLNLKTVGEPLWHKFGGEAGVTGLVMLTESHLACHTYPEYETATFNLYCCRTRPTWNWETNLIERLGAKNVSVTKIERGTKSNAVVPTAVSDASRVRVKSTENSNFPSFRLENVKVHKRGYLPHWEQENGIYFVTFRLADSLPKTVVEEIKYERTKYEKALTNLERELKPDEKRKMETLFSEKLNQYLDAGYGECYLQKPEIAELVENALKFYDEEKYRLFAWCVMPNHVHVLLQVFPRQSLSEITHSWKSFTAHKISKLLNLSGRVWQRESYDRSVRQESSFYKTVQYILDNPKKANLSDWRWVAVQNISENRFMSFAEQSEGTAIF